MCAESLNLVAVFPWSLLYEILFSFSGRLFPPILDPCIRHAFAHSKKRWTRTHTYKCSILLIYWIIPFFLSLLICLPLFLFISFSIFYKKILFQQRLWTKIIIDISKDVGKGFYWKSTKWICCDLTMTRYRWNWYVGTLCAQKKNR